MGIITKYLVFINNNKYYGILESFVSSVLYKLDVHNFPALPEFYDGVIYYEDKLIPLMNLDKRLNFETNTKKEELFLLIEIKEIEFFIPIEKVLDIVSVDNKDIKKISKEDFILGEFTYDNKEIKILDAVNLYEI